MIWLCFQTSDITIPNSKLQQTVVLVSGFKKEYTVDEVSKLLPKHVMEHVFDVSDDVNRIQAHVFENRSTH